MDSARRGLVRLNPETGEVDIDKRWFSSDEKTELFIGSGGERCHAWLRDVLVQAEWSDHDLVDVEGQP
jgi:hypothetical protein